MSSIFAYSVSKAIYIHFQGHYIFTEASRTGKMGDKARIISKQLEATKGLCLSFWYHMYGDSMGSLNVIIKSKSGSESVIWSMAGNRGDQWIYANKTITSPTKFQVTCQRQFTLHQKFCNLPLKTQGNQQPLHCASALHALKLRSVQNMKSNKQKGKCWFPFDKD